MYYYNILNIFKNAYRVWEIIIKVISIFRGFQPSTNRIFLVNFEITKYV